jgi:hypothetical protein
MRSRDAVRHRLTRYICAVQAHCHANLELMIGYAMRTRKLIGMFLAATGLCVTALANADDAGKMNALLGDWDLNVAKSKFEPSPPMKKYTMKVIDAGTGHVLIKSDWIDSDGTVGHVEYSTALDGKPISIIDYPIADTVTDTVVNATTWKSVWTKDGKVVERELETISADGKTFREVDQGKDEKGKKYKNYLVFERP